MVKTIRLPERQEARTANRRLAQWLVTWLIEHSASLQHLWYIDSFVLRNLPLRQAPNHWRQCFGDIANLKLIDYN